MAVAPVVAVVVAVVVSPFNRMKARFLWRAFKARYRDQVAEMRAIRAAVRPEDTVCDVGANKGSYIYWLSRWASRGRVIAFEPQERLCVYLRNVCDALSLRNVTIEAKAVHARKGTVNFHIPGEGDSPGASMNSRMAAHGGCRTVQVPVVSLDEYFPPETRVSVLKIDVEGAELGLFQGATRILKQHGPLLVFECENRHMETGGVQDVFRYLEGLGYSGRFVHGRELRPLAEFDASIHQRQVGDRFWDAKDYYNNFVFEKRP